VNGREKRMVKVAETIVKEREFSYQGAVYVKELQAYVKKWFGKNGYDLFEKGYQAKASDAGKNTTMKWEGGKKLDGLGGIAALLRFRMSY